MFFAKRGPSKVTFPAIFTFTVYFTRLNFNPNNPNRCHCQAQSAPDLKKKVWLQKQKSRINHVFPTFTRLL